MKPNIMGENLRTAAVGILVLCTFKFSQSETIPLPSFRELQANYPGYHRHGGTYRRSDIIRLLGVQESAAMLLHDSSALRISYTFNKIGNQHSIGMQTIHLSKYGTDSVAGANGLQYIFHPLAFGPYLADKYGYPNVTKMHLFDPIKTKESFRGKQGIMRVITYAQHDNEPKGHVALWDCTGFYKAKDFFKGHTLLSVEFWESPDTDCSSTTDTGVAADPEVNQSPELRNNLLAKLLAERRRHLTHRKHG